MTKMTRGSRSTISDLLKANRSVLAAALPKHLDVDRMLRVSLACISTSPKLLECTTESLLSAVMQSARLGLELGGPLGQAYLIPYGATATFQPGYKGLCQLALRSGQVDKVWARVVHKKDEFSYQLGSEEWIKHVPTEDAEPGEIRCVYACAKMKDSAIPAMVVLFPRQVARRRASSRAASKGDSPWQTHPEEMWEKSAAIALMRFMPLSPDLQEAVNVAATEEMGAKSPFIDITPEEGARAALEAAKDEAPAPPPEKEFVMKPTPAKEKVPAKRQRKPKPDSPAKGEPGWDSF